MAFEAAPVAQSLAVRARLWRARACGKKSMGCMGTTLAASSPLGGTPRKGLVDGEATVVRDGDGELGRSGG